VSVVLRGDDWAKVWRLADARSVPGRKVSASEIIREAVADLPDVKREATGGCASCETGQPAAVTSDGREICTKCAAVEQVRKETAMTQEPEPDHEEVNRCACGCGAPCERTFVAGHNFRLRRVVTNIAMAVLAVAVTWGGWGNHDYWNKPRLAVSMPRFGSVDSGRVVTRLALVRNSGGGKLWGSIRQSPRCGLGYSILLADGRTTDRIDYILGKHRTMPVVIRYAPAKSGKQPLRFDVGQR
jgi:hypothetical protein